MRAMAELPAISASLADVGLGIALASAPGPVAAGPFFVSTGRTGLGAVWLAVSLLVGLAIRDGSVG
jgi:hypothetical protein